MRRPGSALLTLGIAAAILIATMVPTAAAGFVNWQAYLYSEAHSSFSPATAITPANAAKLKRVWHWTAPGPTVAGQPPIGFISSPVTYNGTIYIGSNTGVFYALNESTGKVIWSQMLGYITKRTCAARGVSATATVALDPVTSAPVVYVPGGDGNLYALDAATGSLVWKSVIYTPSPTKNDYYSWASPAVANGIVYEGVSSQCDRPLVPGGGLRAYDQASGALVATYLSMPNHELGGSIWSSPAVDSNGDVFVTTGNAATGVVLPGDSSSIVELRGTDLTRLAAWSIPLGSQVGDDDWAASPTVFSALLNGVQTEMVGACNKNGSFYAFQAQGISGGPVWSFQVGVGTPEGVQSCLGAAIWDGSLLYEPGNATTINNVAYPGSMRAIDPAAGQSIWELGMPGIVLGSPSMDAGGVIAAPTYGPGTVSGVYLLRSDTGAILRFIRVGKAFSQPVFSDGYLIIAAQGGGLNVYR